MVIFPQFQELLSQKKKSKYPHFEVVEKLDLAQENLNILWKHRTFSGRFWCTDLDVSYLKVKRDHINTSVTAVARWTTKAGVCFFYVSR